MSLLRIARIFMAVAIIGVFALAIIGANGWRIISHDLDTANLAEDLQRRATENAIAIDYATLLRNDPMVFDQIAENSRTLGQELETIDHPSAAIVSRRFGEIAYLADTARETLSSAASPASMDQRLNVINQQIRIHNYDLNDGMREITHDLRSRIFRDMALGLMVFSVGIAIFAGLCVLGFWIIRRRISGPVKAIESALNDVAAGRVTTRIPPLGTDELGRLAATFNNMMDRRAHDADELRNREERLRAIIETEPECVKLVSPDGILTEMNPAGLFMVEAKTRDDVLDCPVINLVHPDDRTIFEALHAKALNGVDGEGTFRLIGLDGTERWVESHATPLRTADGAIDSVLSVTRDITDRMKLEDQLRQSQRLDAVGQLTGGIAHDFNNLLTVILGNAETLAQKLKGQESLHKLAEMTRTAALRGADLTSRLLAFARKQALVPRVTDVNMLVGNMDSLLRRTLGEHIEMEVVQRGGLWKALVDAAQLENAILNLCLNARDAMPAGGRLTLETANAYLDDEYAATAVEVYPGQYVMVAVSDTGTGMDTATLARAFEPFFTTKEVDKGSGLGLSMVYGFIKQSKGHVRIYSEPGEGTTIKLYLPRAMAEADVAQTREDNDSGDVHEGSERILLVEDDDLVRAHVEAQLISLGYDVVSASDGLEALGILERNDGFNLLFTDIVMPGGMSGRQLADKARETHPDLPVLFTSGYTENAIVHHGRLDPGVFLLQKPYRKRELAAKLRTVIGSAPAENS